MWDGASLATLLGLDTALLSTTFVALSVSSTDVGTTYAIAAGILSFVFVFASACWTGGVLIANQRRNTATAYGGQGIAHGLLGHVHASRGGSRRACRPCRVGTQPAAGQQCAISTPSRA